MNPTAPLTLRLDTHAKPQSREGAKRGSSARRERHFSTLAPLKKGGGAKRRGEYSERHFCLGPWVAHPQSDSTVMANADTADDSLNTQSYGSAMSRL